MQVEPLLPPQGHAALPQPEALPPVAGRGPGQQCPKEERGDEQGHGQLGQHCGRDQRQQQAEGKGNACRCKKDETALLGAGQQVGRHPELRQQLPEQCLLAAAVDEQRQLGGAAARRYKDRPALHQPGGGGDADICKADLACPHPALEVPQPAAPAADLVGRVPDSVVHGLGKAAHQAGPQQKACGRQQPCRACREPPRRESGQKAHLDLGKNGRVPVRNIPGLAHGQHEQGQRGEAVGPQKTQRRPLPSGGPVQGRLYQRHQLVCHRLGIGFGQADRKGVLLRRAHRVKGQAACPGHPVEQGPVDGQCSQHLAPQGTIQPDAQPPVQMKDTGVVQAPAAHMQDAPAHGAEQKEQQRILPQSRVQGGPVPLKQHLNQRQQIDHQRLAQKPQNGKGVQAAFVHRISSARAWVRAAACSAGTAGKISRVPGAVMTTTDTPASRSSGVRSRNSPVTALRRTARRSGKAMPEYTVRVSAPSAAA